MGKSPSKRKSPVAGLKRLTNRGEIAQTFLRTHAARFATGAGGRKLENTEVAAIGRSITLLVACRRDAAGAGDSPAGGGR